MRRKEQKKSEHTCKITNEASAKYPRNWDGKKSKNGTGKTSTKNIITSET
jgi:hypothetical protein